MVNIMGIREVLEWIALRIQTFLMSIIATGSVPEHIAFIMDGNRRYAKRQNINKIGGHALGWKSLEKTLSWCFTIGVRIVTVYAFSIENFNRDPEEVEYLFEMVIEKLNYLLSHRDQIDIYKVRIQILGQVDLLPLNVQRAISEAEKSTKNNHGRILNICIPYTSRQELSQALARQRESHSRFHFETYLYTYPLPPIDLLIRTSGERRLSDFMLYQCHKNCHIAFVNTAWPEFSFWDAWTILLDYQLSLKAKHRSMPHDYPEFSTRLPRDKSRFDSSIHM